MSEDQYDASTGRIYPVSGTDQPIVGVPNTMIGTHSYYHTACGLAGTYIGGMTQDNVYRGAGYNVGASIQHNVDSFLRPTYPHTHRLYPPVANLPVTRPLVVARIRQHATRTRDSTRPYSTRDGSLHRPQSRSGPSTPSVSHEIAGTQAATGHVGSTPIWRHITPPPPPPPSRSMTDVDAALAFAQSSFPIGTPDFMIKQAKIYDVMMSSWKMRNELEPSQDILLEFATKESGFWMCAFYIDGRRCERSMTDRSRQIIEHIRRHIKLEPYVCEGAPCPTSETGCSKRYSSGDPLKKHRDGNLKGESICDQCGRTLLPGNVIRHRNNSCRETTGHL